MKPRHLILFFFLLSPLAHGTHVLVAKMLRGSRTFPGSVCAKLLENWNGRALTEVGQFLSPEEATPLARSVGIMAADSKNNDFRPFYFDVPSAALNPKAQKQMAKIADYPERDQQGAPRKLALIVDKPEEIQAILSAMDYLPDIAQHEVHEKADELTLWKRIGVVSGGSLLLYLTGIADFVQAIEGAASIILFDVIVLEVPFHLVDRAGPRLRIYRADKAALARSQEVFQTVFQGKTDALPLFSENGLEGNSVWPSGPEASDWEKSNSFFSRNSIHLDIFMRTTPEGAPQMIVWLRR